jgi:hypothetical protein
MTPSPDVVVVGASGATIGVAVEMEVMVLTLPLSDVVNSVVMTVLEVVVRLEGMEVVVLGADVVVSSAEVESSVVLDGCEVVVVGRVDAMVVEVVVGSRDVVGMEVVEGVEVLVTVVVTSSSVVEGVGAVVGDVGVFVGVVGASDGLVSEEGDGVEAGSSGVLVEFDADMVKTCRGMFNPAECVTCVVNYYRWFGERGEGGLDDCLTAKEKESEEPQPGED